MRARRPPVTALAAAALMQLAGCGHKAGPAHRGPAGEVVVAKLNGQNLYASDVDREALAEGLIGRGQALTPNSALFRQVLEEVEDERLLAAEAVRRGLDRSPQGRRALASARDRVLSDLVLERMVKGAVREDTVRGLYAEMVRDTPPTQQIAIRQIVLASQADAAQVKSRLETGADFADVAAQRSTDQATRLSGGVLPPMGVENLPPDYAGPLRNAKAGQIVGPFKTSTGWVVARVDARGPAAAPSLAAARPQIIRFLTYDQVKDLVLDLRRRARIQNLLPQMAQPPGAGAATTPAAAGLKGERP